MRKTLITSFVFKPHGLRPFSGALFSTWLSTFRRLRRERRMLASALALSRRFWRADFAVVRVSLVVVVHVMEGACAQLFSGALHANWTHSSTRSRGCRAACPTSRCTCSIDAIRPRPCPRADALEGARRSRLRADRVRRPRRYARRTRQAVVAAVEHAARRGEPHDRADDLCGARP